MDLLFQIGVSNTCVALILAASAVLVCRKSNQPQLGHLLWLLVFVKLMTPPLINVPLPEALAQLTPGITDSIAGTGLLTSSAIQTEAVSLWSTAKFPLALIWAFGAGFVFLVSVTRIVKFDRLLSMSSEPAPGHLLREVHKLGSQLGIKTRVTVCRTTANISPMVWWVGGQVRLILPRSLIEDMAPAQIRWVIAHELAHIRRRDYLVRWLEWLVWIFFWWNPLVWWAGRNLRAAEELCCDALVLATFEPRPRDYASSILAAVESLVQPLRVPAMASEVNSGGVLERRIRVLLSGTNRPLSRALRFLVILTAIVTIPLGVLHADPADTGASWETKSPGTDPSTIYDAEAGHIKQLAEDGEISKEDATAKLKGLKQRVIYKEAQINVERAIKAGELSEKDGDMKLAGLKKELARWPRDPRQILAIAGEKLKRAVKTGSISPEDGLNRWQLLSKQLLQAATSKKTHKQGVVIQVTQS